MKKTAISLLLVLAMVLCVMLVAAPKAEAEETKHPTHCVCGDKADGIGDHDCDDEENEIDGSKWEPLNDEPDIAAGGTLGKAGTADKPSYHYYYLSGPLTITSRLMPASYANITICLNGFTLSNSENAAKKEGRVFDLATGSYATLNICDCSDDNKGAVTAATANSGAVFCMQTRGSTINVYGGTFSGSGKKATGDGGLVRMNVSSQKFNMYGGEIGGGMSEKCGGNIWVDAGKVNMYGGKISGGSDSIGAGIWVGSSGTFNAGENAVIQTAVYDVDSKTLTLNANLEATIDLGSQAKADTVINLNGKTLSGTIKNSAYDAEAETPTVYKVYVIDSATEGFDCTNGYGKLTATAADGITMANLDGEGFGAPVELYGKQRYVAIDEGNGAYSFHRIYVGINGVNVIQNKIEGSDKLSIGLGYTTAFKGDAKVAELLSGDKAFGIKVGLTNAEGNGFVEGDDTPKDLGKAADQFVAGANGNEVKLYVYAILNGDDKDATDVKADIRAETFITLGDKTITSNAYNINLLQVIKAMQDKKDQLTTDAAGLLNYIEINYAAALA